MQFPDQPKESVPFAPSRHEWDFDPVPDDEIIACCLWEYGRESETLGMVAADYWVTTRHIWLEREYAADPELEKHHASEQERIEKWLEEMGYDYDSFCQRFWETDYPLIEIYEALANYGGMDALPWQSLEAKGRKQLVRKVGESQMIRPLALASVGELEKLWEANSSRLLEIRAENRDPDDDSEECEMFSETTPREIREDDESPAKRFASALSIDFSRFTDREILAAFGALLKEMRPAYWKSPQRVFPNSPRRGRRLVDYRVALDRLGLMRLLHDNYPQELRECYPTIWKRLCSDDTHFRRDCKSACVFFRRLFPFLPEDGLPRSFRPMEELEPQILREPEVADGDKKS